MSSIVIAGFIFLIKLPLEQVFLVLAPVPSLCCKIGIGLSEVQLLMLLQESRNREPFAAGHAGPRLFARVRSLVHIEMGRKLVGFATNVAAERPLVGMKPDVDFEISDLGERLIADSAAVRPLSCMDPQVNSKAILAGKLLLANGAWYFGFGDVVLLMPL